MKLPGALVLAALGLASSSPCRAADPAKVEYSERNTPFAPASTVSPAQRTPELNRSVQDRRINPAVSAPESTSAADRLAATAVTETRDKVLITPDSHRPESAPVERNSFDQRRSRIQTATDTKQPQLVERYRTSISADTLSHQGRLTAADVGTTARVNRFVFRRNVATPQGTAAATPAGGRSVGPTPSRAP
jgi:hypothetical protein